MVAQVCKRRDVQCSNETTYPLCFSCLKALRDKLLSLSEYTAELETQITRQSVGVKSVGGSNSETPLVFDQDSSEARDHVLTVLEHWFAINSEKDSHRLLQGLTVERRIRTLIHWHLKHTIELGRTDAGPDMLADFDVALARAMRAVDRKSSKIWIGNCDCGEPVLAYPKQKGMVVCSCGSEYDPGQSRRDLRVLGGEQLVTARQAEMLGEVWGKAIKKATVDKWFQRGRIECRSQTCTKGHTHEYRMSELLVIHREN